MFCRMNIAVEHIDTAGNSHNLNKSLPWLGFIKHMAFAGQGPYISPRKLMRVAGMFFHYSYYLQSHAFRNNHFSLPPRILSDPTEQSQFSNIAGRAIADFLSKKIDRSLYTVIYEALAPRPMIGPRPDLIAFSRASVFVLESKGRGAGNPGDMTEHKLQATSGTYPRNFSIASVSYDLFNQVKCNYHDPYNQEVPYDEEGLRRATRRYYANLHEFINERYFYIEEFNFQNEKFYAIEFRPRNFKIPFENEMPWHPLYMDLLNYFRPRLILPYEISNYANFGLTRNMVPFEQKEDDDSVYIDNDRVGLQFRRH
jgi:hypothetical protein